CSKRPANLWPSGHCSGRPPGAVTGRTIMTIGRFSRSLAVHLRRQSTSCATAGTVTDLSGRFGGWALDKLAVAAREHTVAYPVEQRRAEFGLKQLDTPAGRGLGQVQGG